MKTLIEKLPHPFGILLDEYYREKHPYVKLHRICECSEMLIRFLAIVSLAEIYRSNPGGEFPETIKSALLGKDHSEGVFRPSFSMPSFGDWLRILKDSLNQISSTDQLIAKSLHEMTRTSMEFIYPETNRSINNSVYELRNALAHDGRFTVERANHFLIVQGHETRFVDFWMKESTASFFSGLELWGTVEDSTDILLHGNIMNLEMLPHCSLNDIGSLGSINEPLPAGSIFLKRKNRAELLLLYPLFFIGKIHQNQGKLIQPVTNYSSTQTYCRKGPQRLEYTAFDALIGRSVATDELESAFNSLFPLGKWREALEREERKSKETQRIEQLKTDKKDRGYGFRDIIKHNESYNTVERAEEIIILLEWLEQNSSGLGLVVGKPGMGKTTLAVNLYKALRRRFRKWVIINYFFVSGDERNCISDFMRCVSIELKILGAKEEQQPINPNEAQEEFINLFRSFISQRSKTALENEKIVLLLDGVDEIGRISPDFFGLLKSISADNVVCLCFGRPTPTVFDGLRNGNVDLIFGKEGLQPLKREAVRQFLSENLGRRIYEFLDIESDEGSNRFLDALTEKSRSLPLYLQLLLNDLLNGEYDFRRPDKLPRSLEAYYTKMITEGGMDPARNILAQIIALVSVAYSPLWKDLVKRLLQDEVLSQDDDWETIIDNALEFGAGMLQKAPALGGLNGFTVYHGSLRDYFLESEEKSYTISVIGPLTRMARKRLLKFCSKWKEHTPGSPEAEYTLRFYPRHLVDSGRLSELVPLFTNLRYIEDRIRIRPVPELSQEIIQLCNRIADEEQKTFLLKFAETLDQYAEFLSRHPDSLFQCAWNRLDQDVSIDSNKTDQSSFTSNTLERWNNEMGESGRYWLRVLHPQSKMGPHPPLSGAGGLLFGKAISRDGKLFAQVDFFGDTKEMLISGKDQRGIFVWRTNGQFVLKIPFSDFGPCIPIAFGKGGKYLLVGSDTCIHVWDVHEGKNVRSMDALGKIVAAASASANLPLRLLTSDGCVHSWNEDENSWVTKPLPVSGPIVFGDFSEDVEGCFLVTHIKRAILVLDCANIRSQVIPDGFNLNSGIDIGSTGIRCPLETDEAFRDLVVSDQLDFPLSPGELSFLEELSPACDTKELFSLYGMVINPLVSCSFVTSSVAAIHAMKTEINEQDRYDTFYKSGVSVWNMESPTDIHRFSWPGVDCTSIEFSEDGCDFAVGLSSGHTHILDHNAKNKEANLTPVPGPVSSILFLPHGEGLIISGNSVRIDTTDKNISSHKGLISHNRTITISTASNAGQFFATGDEEGGICIWDAISGCLSGVHIPRLGYIRQNEQGKWEETDDISSPFFFKTGHTRPIVFLSYLPYDDRLISVSEDGECWLWEPDGIKYRERVMLDPDVEYSPARVWAAVSKRGSHLAIMNMGGNVCVWAIDQNFKEVYRRSLENCGPAGLAISSDGEYVAIASYVSENQEDSFLSKFTDQKIDVICLSSGEFELSFRLPFEMQTAIAFLKLPFSSFGKPGADANFKKVFDLWKSLGERKHLNEFLLQHGLVLDAEGHVFGFHLVAYSDNGRGYARFLGPNCPLFELPQHLPGFYLNPIKIGTSADCAKLSAFRDGTTLRIELPDKFTVIKGEGDLKAIAEGADKCPFIAFKPTQEDITRVEEAQSGIEIAWYHLPLSNLSIQPKARTILGSFGSEVHILKLEGPDKML